MSICPNIKSVFNKMAKSWKNEIQVITTNQKNQDLSFFKKIINRGIWTPFPKNFLFEQEMKVN